MPMAKYLLIESRDPFDSSDSEYFGELKMKHPLEIDKDVAKMIEKGVSIYLDEENARERGLTDEIFSAASAGSSGRAFPSLSTSTIRSGTGSVSGSSISSG